jgi:hypothetical protein
VYYGPPVNTAMKRAAKISPPGVRPWKSGILKPKISAIREQVNLMNAASDMDEWTLYMWKALELPTGPAEKKRAPYYGNWFFIPFEKLHMSLMTFKIDDETRDVIERMSDVKNTRTPAPEEGKKALATLAVIVNVNHCKFNPALIQTVGVTTVNR